MKEGRVFRYYLGEPKSYFEVEIGEDPLTAERYHVTIKGVKDFEMGVDQVEFIAPKSGLKVLQKILTEALNKEE